MFKKEMKNNIKMIICKMVYLPTLLCGSESWTVLTRYENRFAGREMRYCSQTGRDRIRNRIAI
jgi:hypothetical protein